MCRNKNIVSFNIFFSYVMTCWIITCFPLTIILNLTTKTEICGNGWKWNKIQVLQTSVSAHVDLSLKRNTNWLRLENIETIVPGLLTHIMCPLKCWLAEKNFQRICKNFNRDSMKPVDFLKNLHYGMSVNTDNNQNWYIHKNLLLVDRSSWGITWWLLILRTEIKLKLDWSSFLFENITQNFFNC